MFTAESRIVINGRLAAFAGERMTEQEALRRGIRHAQAAKPALTKAQIAAELEARGVPVPPRASKTELLELLGD